MKDDDIKEPRVTGSSDGLTSSGSEDESVRSGSREDPAVKKPTKPRGSVKSAKPVRSGFKGSSPKNRLPIRDLVEPKTTVDEFFLEDRTIEAEKLAMRKKLGMSLPEDHKKIKVGFFDSLKFRIYRAGIKIDSIAFIKIILHVTLVLLLITSLGLGIVLLSNGFSYGSVVFWLVVWIIIGFILLYSLCIVITRVYLDYRIFKRRLEIEKVLPEFLRLVATNYRSGLPLDKALIKSNRPRFGIFSKEIEIVAKTTHVKGDLAKSLEIFGKKFESKILEQAVNAIAISIRSGSNISSLLEEIASNITKMRNMRSSMAANVKNYVIFIVVAGVIIAPLMFSMSFQMGQTIDSVRSKINLQNDVASTTSMPTIGSISSDGGVRPGDFDVFAILMMLTNAVISGLVISMIKHGNVQQGIKNIPLFAVISIVLYFVGKLLLHGLFVML